MPAADDRETELARCLARIGPVVVGFSGGVDSTLVVAAARRALGRDRVLAVTADSPSLPEGDIDRCRALAGDLDVDWRGIGTDEFSDRRYRRNDGDRCYWCKTALMDVCGPVAADRSATVLLGVNLDDLDDHRPGQRAAAERGARFPLVEAGFTKDDVRALARAWGLPVWDRPASPCLSSRVPYGTAVTVPVVRRVDRAEREVRAFGFDDVRVRHYGTRARVEVPRSALPLAGELRADIEAAVAALGYDEVEVDPRGLRSGNLNEVLR